MPLGLAVIIATALYLIDKHNAWRKAVSFILTTAVLFALVFGFYVHHLNQRDEEARRNSPLVYGVSESICDGWGGHMVAAPQGDACMR